MKFSVVTISYNQAQFLERAINSVIRQEGDGICVEYIVVDPGSSDGSREIIDRYRGRFSHVIFERDKGPADGLNRGFSRATGDVYCYLNSDDEYCPGAFAAVRAYFNRYPDVDVVCGHSYVVTGGDRVLRRVWSDPFHKKSQAYGCSIQMQPSTFIRERIFKKVGGFNSSNRISWDTELLMEIASAGGRIQIMDAFLSKYRVHEGSITGSGSRDDEVRRGALVKFEKLMGRQWRWYDSLIAKFWFLRRQLRNPPAALERLRYGPVYRSAMKKK